MSERRCPQCDDFRDRLSWYESENDRLQRLINCYDPHGPNVDIAPLQGRVARLEEAIEQALREVDIDRVRDELRDALAYREEVVAALGVERDELPFCGKSIARQPKTARGLCHC